MLKTIRIPYKKIQNYILIKEIKYDLRKRYKKVSYAYEEYNNDILKETLYHRINKPAVIIYRNNHINELQYWKFGKLHRTYGPAIIKYDGNKIGEEKWYHHGKKLTDDEIQQELKVINRRKKMFKVILKIKNKL